MGITPPARGDDSSPRGLARTTSGITVLAGIALVASLVVDAALALFFGASRETDAFFIAATIPFAVGSLLLASTNQALVPLLSAWFREKNGTGAERLTAGLLGSILAIASGVAAIGIALSPVLPSVIAPGSPAEVRQQAVSLTMVLFATIVTRSGSEVLRSLLNARFSFYVPAASPLAQSLVVLVVGALGAERYGVAAFAVGYLAGSTLQFIVLLWFASRRGVPMRIRWGFGDEEVRRGLRLLIWPVGSSGALMITRWIERFVASFLAVGSISLLSYAWRIVNAISGTVFFRSVVVAVLPQLSEAKDDPARTRRIVHAGITVMIVISIALMTATMVLAKPAVAVLFQRGEFTADVTRTLAALLGIYAVSFPLAAVPRVLLAFFMARLDLVTPFINRVIKAMVNALLALALAPVLGLQGIVWAHVAASLLAAAHAVFKVKGNVQLQIGRAASLSWRVAAASTVAAGAALIMQELLFEPSDFAGRLVVLGASSASFAVLLPVFMWIFRIDGMAAMMPMRRRRPRSQPPEEPGHAAVRFHGPHHGG